MMKFFKTLTATVLLFGLSFTVLDPVLRQKMLEGENVITSLVDRIEELFDKDKSENETKQEVIVQPDTEEEKEIADNKPSNNTNEEIYENVNIQIPDKEEDKPEVIEPSNKDDKKEEEIKKEDKPKPTITIKPFPNIGKEEEKEEQIPPQEENQETETKPEPDTTPFPEPVPVYTPVYYNQSKDEIGYSEGCLLTSYAMVITNAGRYTGNRKEYNPIDLYLANNPDATSSNSRTVVAWHYVIADAFNYTWNRTRIGGWSSGDKINLIKELLDKNPWGVIIGGSYGTKGTHYIVVRLVNGNLVFDDPVKSKGANIKSISGVYGINSWDKITSVMTITPKLDKKGIWKPGTYEIKKKDPDSYHPCATQMYC